MPFQCKMCSCIFNQRGWLRYHLLIHTKEKAYACETCTKRFKSLTLLKNHTNVHIQKRLFQCLRCTSSFKQKSNFRAHAKMHVDIDSETFYICKMCPSKFYTNKNLKCTWHPTKKRLNHVNDARKPSEMQGHIP